MNILFLTLIKIDTLHTRGIYQDLMNEFVASGDNVYITSPIERREKQPSSLRSEGKVKFLNVRTLNIQKTNLIEKGIATLSIEYLFLRSIKKYFNNVKFDVIIYSTPPITFAKVINFIKKRDGAKSYLLLKDIFPQNAVDLKMIVNKGIIHRYFRQKEINLYKISDRIGCMSPANVNFLLKNNPFLNKSKVEINPNSISPLEPMNLSIEQKNEIKLKFDLPTDKKIFIYGGNLGIPQGIDFLIEILDFYKEHIDIFFLIIGSGTEFNKINDWILTNKPFNVRLFESFPKEIYDEILAACDVGLIFLNRNFSIPNFPSRILSYQELQLPILAFCDKNTDIGKIIQDNKFGYWSESGNLPAAIKNINMINAMNPDELKSLGITARNYLESHFLARISYNKIAGFLK